MASERFTIALRERALESLEESTKMLEVALKLFKQGNRTEAGRIWDEARALRNNSVYLMARANERNVSANFRNSSVSGRLTH